ncbi:MAG: RimK family alpha-L-glutamate ligase [Bacilli bacterium]|nr:RimK family alpha-L-glutamate ligase [Bacilli bacterium]
MTGAIIVNQEVGHNRYKIDRLLEEFEKVDIEVKVLVNDGTLAKIQDNNVELNFDADFVVYLDKDIYLARFIEKCGARMFNKADFIKLCDDKILTFIACSNLGIKMPKTFAGPLMYRDLRNDDYLFLSTIDKELGYPMVVKKVYGSLGEGVYLVKDYNELSNLYSQIYRNPILFQEYVKSSYGRSLRILVIDGKVFGGFVRYNHIDFRSNYGDTADGRTLENSEKYFEFAQDIADKLNIEYAGIDLLFDENEDPILCEINSNAFFEEFEKVTHLNVAEAIVKMIMKKMSQYE